MTSHAVSAENIAKIQLASNHYRINCIYIVIIYVDTVRKKYNISDVFRMKTIALTFRIMTRNSVGSFVSRKTVALFVVSIMLRLFFLIRIN